MVVTLVRVLCLLCNMLEEYQMLHKINDESVVTAIYR